MNMISEQSQKDIISEHDITIFNYGRTEAVMIPSMLPDSCSKRLIKAHAKGLTDLVDEALGLKNLLCDRWADNRRDEA